MPQSKAARKFKTVHAKLVMTFLCFAAWWCMPSLCVPASFDVTNGDGRVANVQAQRTAHSAGLAHVAKVEFTFVNYGSTPSDSGWTRKNLKLISRRGIAEVLRAFERATRERSSSGIEPGSEAEPSDVVTLYDRRGRSVGRFRVIYADLDRMWGPAVKRVMVKYRKRALRQRTRLIQRGQGI